LNFIFNEEIENFLKIITKGAQENNLRVFFVGGIVRDKILNIPTFDIDLLVLGNAIEFAKKLSDKIEIKSIHEDFCTVKIKYNNIEIDIASSRTEKYPNSGCLPILDKIGVELKKDVLRRDFSLNSLYCEIKLIDNELAYNFIDLTNGLADLNNKTLRVLHDKSYIDDPTRIIRGLGFKYRFDFDFSENDKKLINDYLKNIDYTNMSIDRNIKVIKKTLNSKFQKEIFHELIEKKYYKIITPDELKINFTLIELIFDLLKLDMFEMSELYLKIILNIPPQKYSFANSVEMHKTFSKINKIDLAYYYYKTQDENIIKHLKTKDIKLHITGDDLLKSGYKKGVTIGNILNSLLNNKLENPENFKTKTQEMNWISKNFHKN